jgi:hypothetical protein
MGVLVFLLVFADTFPGFFPVSPLIPKISFGSVFLTFGEA